MVLFWKNNVIYLFSKLGLGFWIFGRLIDSMFIENIQERKWPNFKYMLIANID